MGNTIDWGQAAVNNTIGFGDGAENNTIGWGDIQADSWSPETNLTGTGGTPAWSNTLSTTFDGVDDYVDVGRVTSLEGATNFSVSMWLKPTSYAGVRTLFGRTVSGTDMFQASTTDVFGYINFYISNGQSNYPKVTTSSRIDLNTWGLLTFVYDGTLTGNTNKAKIYINGVIVSTTTTASLIPSSLSLDTTDFNIAQRGGVPYTPTSGKIDEVSLYDYSLSASDVTDIYNLGTPTDLSLLATPPLHWYRMGDGSTYPTINDEIGSNDGTMNNMSSANFVTDVPTAPTWSNTLSTNFDTVDTYIDLGGSTGLDFSGSFTLMAWIKTDAIGANQFIIDTSTSGSSGNGYSVRINTDGKIKFWSYAVGGLVNGTTVLSASTWYHVACVHDTVAGINKIYLNGLLENTSSYTFPTASNTANLWIGKSNLFASTFDGLIDEVGFFGTDESANINAIGSTTPTDLSTYSPTSYYRMGDNDVYPIIKDVVGGNNGNMRNMSSANFVADVPT